ncbi:solute carrier family 26 member 10 [Rhinatrema bivittatum]|uniref:solute carrier family 26 member 10 n=1 Tax=Rhinatrema bivittatum TaxID=194408 RepID=UPI00112D176F|nr:solute carrier family 26 member 10 [Rhinatrema bivittatum]
MKLHRLPARNSPFPESGRRREGAIKRPVGSRPLPVSAAAAAMSQLAVYRAIYTEERFQRLHGAAPERAREGLRASLARGCRCSCRGAARLLSARLPVAGWLPRYRLKTCLLGDFVAGLTVGIVHIPQGMAFALLTSVAPVYGLYTSFFPVILYMLFGTGRHVSTGTFAVLSLMTGSVIERLVPKPLDLNATSAEVEEIEQQRIGVAAAIAFLMGLIMIVMFILQLGFLSTYLSEPIVKAFTNGAAFHVMISQIQSMLGLPLPRFTGYFTIFKTLASVFQALLMTNIAELIISFLCLAALVPIKEINSRFRNKLRMPIPGEIVIVLVATGVTFASSLDSQYGIQIVGHIPAGFPEPKLPSLEVIPDVIGDTVAITFVAYAVSVSLAMIYAEKHSYTIDPNQELLAHGISNIISSLFSCFANSATLATTNILESAGGHTQLSGFFTSCVVLVVLIWVGPLFYYLPKAVLACINVVSLRQMFLQFQDLPELWRVSKIDFAVWVVTWLAVIILNVDMGLAVGVVFSMMTVICRTQRAQCSVLGRATNTEIYRPIKQNNKCYEIPGLKILAYNAPVYYGNRNFFKEAMSRLLGLTQEKIRKREKALKALQNGRKMSISTVENGIANPAYLPDQANPSTNSGEEEIKIVVIDCSGIIFIDMAGARLFIQMCTECKKAGILLFLAGCNGNVLRTLACSGLMEHLSTQQVFVTVHDAACFAEQTMGEELESWERNADGTEEESSAQKSSTVWV